MKLIERFEEDRFVITGEIGPPKGASADDALKGAKTMAPWVDAVNVTDNQSAVMRLGSLAVCKMLKDSGIDPVFQLTCRDRNRIALQSDLLSAALLGIDNVLLLTGDHMVLGDHKEAKGVFDLDSVQLIDAAKHLNEGKDLAGHALSRASDLCIGAVVNPGSDELETQIIKMKKKIDAGAVFFQTQTVYDIVKFKRFMDRAEKLQVPIMAGIVPLKSAGMARYMTENIAGVSVPDTIIEELKKTPKKDRRKKTAEISGRFVRDVKPLCQGIHLMPLGWDDLVSEILLIAEIR